VPAEPPTVYLIAGPNGAGKTTFATVFLPHFVHCREFLNADLIAAGLSPFAPETQSIRAGRLLLTRIHELAEARQTFAFETTLAGRGYVRILTRLKRDGYRIILFFLWLPKAEVALKRVANRVRQGGHHIPEPTIRRRYDSGLSNLFKLYIPLLNTWQIYDGNELPPTLIASQSDEGLTEWQSESFRRIRTQWVEKAMHEPAKDPLIEKAAAAFRQAAAKVVRLARQTGTPIITQIDGKVRAVSPENLHDFDDGSMEAHAIQGPT
jgi:predicted ABC-type ATPase